MRQQITAPLSVYPFGRRPSAAFLGSRRPRAPSPPWATWRCSTAGRWRSSAPRGARAASSYRRPTWPMRCVIPARRSSAASTRRWRPRAWRFCWPAPGRSSSVLRAGCTRPSPLSFASRWRTAGCSCSRRSTRPSDGSQRSWQPLATGLSRRWRNACYSSMRRLEAGPRHWRAGDRVGKADLHTGPPGQQSCAALGATPMQAKGAGWPRTSGPCPIPDEVE